jgi:hypothetical protein
MITMQYCSIAVAILIAATVSACVSTSTSQESQEEDRAAALVAKVKAEQEKGQAEREQKYGKCVRDRWQSVSQIGKTRTRDLLRHVYACGGVIQDDMRISRYVSANRQHEFVHFGTYRSYHFVDGLLVSYSTH